MIIENRIERSASVSNEVPQEDKKISILGYFKELFFGDEEDVRPVYTLSRKKWTVKKVTPYSVILERRQKKLESIRRWNRIYTYILFVILGFECLALISLMLR